MERDDLVELIRKYYRGQLSEPEQETFNQLKEDPVFQEELIRFTLMHELLQVQSLQQEATAILSSLETTLPVAMEESKVEAEGQVLWLSREEEQQEQDKDVDSPNENQKQLHSIAADLEEENINLNIPGQEGTQEKRRSSWQWLAAAVTISVICLAGLWRYGQNSNEDLKVSIHQKQVDSTRIAGAPQVANNQPEAPIDTLKSEKDPSKDSPPLPSNPNIAVRKEPIISKAERQQLVKSNFVADSLPSETLEDLEIPSDLYKNQQHQEAIVAYNKVLENLEQSPELASRGLDDSDLTSFLANYYLGQSYFLLNQTAQTIAALESARQQAPNPYWESKTEWYLALAYLQAGKVQDARKLLQQVEENEEAGPYQQKAKQLNNKLKKL